MATSTARSDILVIDDDLLAGKIFEQILREHGYSTHGAADAESALLYCEHAVPAAILLDLRLPTIDGLELLRRIRARAPLAGVPVAVVTGDCLVDEDVVREIETLGARIHFKPLWEEDLVRVVGELEIGSQHPDRCP
jgi:CheY-like chemotaxis protein